MRTDVPPHGLSKRQWDEIVNVCYPALLVWSREFAARASNASFLAKYVKAPQ